MCTMGQAGVTVGLRPSGSCGTGQSDDSRRGYGGWACAGAGPCCGRVTSAGDRGEVCLRSPSRFGRRSGSGWKRTGPPRPSATEYPGTRRGGVENARIPRGTGIFPLMRTSRARSPLASGTKRAAGQIRARAAPPISCNIRRNMARSGRGAKGRSHAIGLERTSRGPSRPTTSATTSSRSLRSRDRSRAGTASPTKTSRPAFSVDFQHVREAVFRRELVGIDQDRAIARDGHGCHADPA